MAHCPAAQDEWGSNDVAFGELRKARSSLSICVTMKGDRDGPTFRCRLAVRAAVPDNGGGAPRIVGKKVEGAVPICEIR
jgi:hypothetical protein